MYPFLFRFPESNRFVVKIASFDYVGYNAEWMVDEEMEDYMLVPDVDISMEKHFFENEQEALEFIRRWWREN